MPPYSVQPQKRPYLPSIAWITPTPHRGQTVGGSWHSGLVHLACPPSTSVYPSRQVEHRGARWPQVGREQTRCQELSVRRSRPFRQRGRPDTSSPMNRSPPGSPPSSFTNSDGCSGSVTRYAPIRARVMARRRAAFPPRAGTAPTMPATVRGPAEDRPQCWMGNPTARL